MRTETQTNRADAVEANAAFDMDRALGYLLLRASLALDLAMHGITRIFIGGVAQFVNVTLTQFQHTPLPQRQVRAFASTLPFLELILGALLFAGLWTRWILTLGALIMMALIFGTSLRSDWNLVFLQMFYALLYFVLLVCRRYDAWSVDALLGKGR